jgi:hypothetical protein
VKPTLICIVAVALGSMESELYSSQAGASLGPTFEVASVRMTKLPAQFSWDIFPGRFTATAAPVRLFISRAYGVPEWRIVDEPRWARDERHVGSGVRNASGVVDR